jgi:catechol 2,3-dioxygenase-like lactoylglutathione lyase family enzyme
MSDAKIVFDHIHLISDDPETTASWYVNILGGEIASVAELLGAPQYRVLFDGLIILIRGRRSGEEPEPALDARKVANGYLHGPQFGTDHFGFRVTGDLDEYCDSLKQKGATFSVEPHDFVPGVRIAFLEAPEGVNIEFVHVNR